jgi:hypothetical protein
MIEGELDLIRHPNPERLLEVFEWEPITDARSAAEREPTDAELAAQGLFRLIPSLAGGGTAVGDCGL